MNANSGSFALLADALQGARPPVRAREVIPTSPPKRKRKREIDRSRDHAVYAAPHRPMRAHAHSRPDDIATERVQRQPSRASFAMIEPPPRARHGLALAVVAFVLASVAAAVAAVLLMR
jgi:hypothetical protein